MIEFTIPGDVVPWARTGTRGTQRFTPKKQRDYAGQIKFFCERAMLDQGIDTVLDGPLEMSIVAVYLWPKSLSARKRALPGAQWKTSRPDGDNITKIVKDALKSIAFRDDAQVAAGFVWKKFGDRAGLTVRIKALGEQQHGKRVAMDGADCAQTVSHVQS